MISIWGWTLVAVLVILATAVVALIIMAIRYLLARMEREAAEPKTVSRVDVTPNREHVGTNGLRMTRDPSPVPPEDPHAPPSSPTGLTRPGY
jgi:hypothetical protein